MRKKIITFDVGTNFDDSILDFIRENDKEKRIKTLYGKVKDDGLSGGRNAMIESGFLLENLGGYVAKCKEAGVEFNYLINPLCMGQRETDPETASELRNVIHNIYDMGVRQFTVNSPLLVRYLKSTFKDVWVTLGLYAYPTTLQQVNLWVNWGVDEITLDLSFNRDFLLLEKLLTMYKDSGVSFRLIANNLCVKDCMLRLSHGNFVSHSSDKGMVMDYCLVNCTRNKIENPALFISSEWIRPEDIHYYEELCEKTGNYNFSIKLVDRTKSVEFIKRVMTAYLNRSYDGNLIDILNWNERKKMTDLKGRMPFKGAMNMNPDIMRLYGRVMCNPEIMIDNKKLDGFIEHFVNGSNCTDKICDTVALKCGLGCAENCGYCNAWAKKAVSYNQAEVDDWLKCAANLSLLLESGEFSGNPAAHMFKRVELKMKTNVSV